MIYAWLHKIIVRIRDLKKMTYFFVVKLRLRVSNASKEIKVDALKRTRLFVFDLCVANFKESYSYKLGVFNHFV